MIEKIRAALTIHRMASFETIEVRTLEVACDGGGGPLGHPRVFLHIDQDVGEITCPYCSRTFVFQSGEPETVTQDRGHGMQPLRRSQG